MTELGKAVSRVTRGALDGHHGADRGRRLVASLEVGDLITLRPQGTRRTETVSLFDLYDCAIRWRLNRTQLEKAREKKAKRLAAAKTRRLARDVRKAAAHG